MIQDDRQWGPTFSVRIGHNGGSETFKAGEPFTVFLPVAAHKSRQECVLLPLEALKDALS